MALTKTRKIGRILNLNSRVTALDSDFVRVVDNTVNRGGVLSVVATINDLPGSPDTGDRALVSDISTLYVRTENGWSRIALINSFNPEWITQPDSTYDLATNSTPTVITMLATDSDLVPIKYIATTDSSFDAIATVSHDSDKHNVFTVVPIDSEGGAATGGTGTITFKATDGVNLVQQVSTFSLSFGPDWSGSVTEKKLTGSGLAASDNFGTSVALSGDGLYALVGSPFDDDTYSGSGSAFVFTNNGSNVWSQQVKLAGTSYATTNPPTSGYLYFGMCARLNSDGSRAAVSAYRANHSSTSGQDFGQIYVLTRSGTSWSKEATLDAPEAMSYMTKFDANQDMTYIVSGSGSKDKVSVYTRSGTSWSHQQTFTGGVSSSGVSQFGRNVGISEDTNYIIVGATQDDYNSVSNAGAAYIWKRSGSTWSQEAALYGSDRAANEQMGYGVALNSDATIAVAGARYASGGGAAYVYTRSGSTWSQVQKLTGEHGPTWSGGGAGYVLSFGYRVHIPKGNDDLLLISAPKSHKPSPFVVGRGEVYVFEKTGTGASTYSYRTSLFSSIDLGSGSNETGEDLQSSNDGTFIIGGAHVLDFTADNAGGAYVWTV